MKIQLKRSDVLDGGKAKEPTSANMKDGELAINYNSIDPSFFIKDSNGEIRKLSLVDTENVQSDWSESNPNSPAYIKNKQLVNQEIADLESLVNTKIGDAPIDNYMYGRLNSTWQRIEVTEATKDGKGYVRKDGAWYAIENYNYATEEFATNEAAAASLLALNSANSYTDQKIIELNDVIFTSGFITDAPADGEQYARKDNNWVVVEGGSGGGDISNPADLMYKSVPQDVTGQKRFTNSFRMQGDGEIESGVLKLKNNGVIRLDDGNAAIDFGDNVRVRKDSRGFTLRRNDQSGSGGESGTGGGRIEFIDNQNNMKVGIRNNNPDVALTVSSTVKANQYQEFRSIGKAATFDGRLFVSPDGFDFADSMRLHSDLYQEGGTYRKVQEQSVYGASAVSTAEKTVASSIRAAIRGYTKNGKRCFEVDKQTLVSAFTAAGLDIGNYDIVKEVEQTEHTGFVDDDIDMNIPGYAAGTYTAVNYENLFAFLLAAGPDLSALEARIAALEGA